MTELRATSPDGYPVTARDTGSGPRSTYFEHTDHTDHANGSTSPNGAASSTDFTGSTGSTGSTGFTGSDSANGSIGSTGPTGSDNANSANSSTDSTGSTSPTDLNSSHSSNHSESSKPPTTPTTLLIIHPGGGDLTSWDAVATLLRPDFRVVQPQRRIYAPGADITLPHSVAVEAADVLAITEILEPPIVLVGHSSGAVAALEAALATPSAYAGLVLYEPPLPTRSLVGGAAVVEARAVFEKGDPVEAMRIHLRDIVRFPGDLVDAMLADEQTQQAFTTHAGAQIADAEAIDALGVGTERFAALDVPTVLIEGDTSPAHLRERLADLAAVLPDAEVVTLAGQGHIAHIAAPDLLAETVRRAARRFVAAHESEAANRG
ncbi:hypothetical protein GCM10009839_81140 [Catenulispora yoronensis]|uniref:AB hydrolase-1 domain-containing protein n=1 Tax=Catenulispora yoronensis TaxID=450799 RepID=A0ABN2VHL1_9ACTN